MPLRRRGRGRLRPLEGEFPVVHVHAHGVALTEAPFEQLERERVLQQPLDRALQRPGAVRGIPACLGEMLLCSVGQLEVDPPLGEPFAESAELELDDLRELLA